MKLFTDETKPAPDAKARKLATRIRELSEKLGGADWQGAREAISGLTLGDANFLEQDPQGNADSATSREEWRQFRAQLAEWREAVYSEAVITVGSLRVTQPAIESEATRKALAGVGKTLADSLESLIASVLKRQQRIDDHVAASLADLERLVKMHPTLGAMFDGFAVVREFSAKNKYAVGPEVNKAFRTAILAAGRALGEDSGSVGSALSAVQFPAKLKRG